MKRAGGRIPARQFVTRTANYGWNLRRNHPAKPIRPEPKSMTLLGSGTEPVLVVVVVVLLPVARTVNASEGIDPTEFSEAEDGPEFSSQ